MRVLIVLSLLFSLSACATTESKTPQSNHSAIAIELGGLDTQQANTALFQALLKQGYLVESVKDSGVAVQFGKHQFLLETQLDKTGFNRILVNRFYAVHPKVQNSDQLYILISSLNQQLNFAKFVVRQKGTVVQLQTAASFNQSIELEEIRKFLLWTSDGIEHVANGLPKELGQVIKPIPVMKPKQPI